jgi:hypothetical protein
MGTPDTFSSSTAIGRRYAGKSHNHTLQSACRSLQNSKEARRANASPVRAVKSLQAPTQKLSETVHRMGLA